ncbi:MAG: sensor histidine kinase [Mycobacterium leprae]
MDARRRWFGTLGWRLLAAFLTVAVGAVALLALTAAVSVDRGTTALLAAQRTQLRTQIASALADAYTAGRGSWPPTDLAGVQTLATAQGTRVVMLDRNGHEVATVEPRHSWNDEWMRPRSPAPSTWPTTPRHTEAPGGHDGRGGTPTPGPSQWSHDSSRAPRHTPHDDWRSPDDRREDSHALPTTPVATAPVVLATGPRLRTAADNGMGQVTVPVIVNGTRVGTAQLTLPAGADSPVTAARAALLRSVGIGAALAVLLATVTAVLVSRRVSRPLVALTAATRSFAAGEPVPDGLLRPAPGELGELGRAFTAMAATVRRQDELRRSVVADVAHELRTPVTILRGQTEQLLDGIALPTPGRLVSLHDEVLRLERLTDDLATLSAADAAGLMLHTRPVDLGELARQAVEAMSAGFDDADLHVRLKADDGIVVMADATRLIQVVTNLLTNAAKFTPAGGTVTVTVGNDGAYGVLTVADTGPGIAADELPHLFERFWRGHTAGSRSGTGIGLAVVHALVTAHRGTVTAASPSDGGARFTVRLPAADPLTQRYSG